MKRIVTAMVALGFLTACASVAQAQGVGVGIGQSNSTSGAASTSGSQSSIVFNQPATVTNNNKQSGTTTVKTAPSLGGLALGGGHPCAYSPATGQLSIIGGGAGFGGMQIDTACMLLINAAASGDIRAYNAAMNMLAARDPAACKAMYQAGMVADCVDKRGKSTVKAAPVSNQSTPSKVSTKNRVAPAYFPQTTCNREGGKLRYSVDAHFADKQSARSNCLKRLKG